jgi:hypothetical protein
MSGPDSPANVRSSLIAPCLPVDATGTHVFARYRSVHRNTRRESWIRTLTLPPCHCQEPPACGLMFWFSRNTFVGS